MSRTQLIGVGLVPVSFQVANGSMSRDEFLVLIRKCGVYADPDIDILGVMEEMDRVGVDAVLNARDGDSFSCMVGALTTPDPSLLMFLLQKGANPNKIFVPSRSSLFDSIFSNLPLVPLNLVVNLAGAELLLAYGANLHKHHGYAALSKQAYLG